MNVVPYFLPTNITHILYQSIFYPMTRTKTNTLNANVLFVSIIYLNIQDVMMMMMMAVVGAPIVPKSG